MTFVPFLHEGGQVINPDIQGMPWDAILDCTSHSQFIGSCSGRLLLPSQDITAFTDGVVHAKSLASLIESYKRLAKGTAKRGTQCLME